MNLLDITVKLLTEGMLDKNDYERRQNNIAKRNQANYEILKDKLQDDDLALDISNLLDTITKMRHEIHSSDDLFNPESSNYHKQLDFIDSINSELYDLGLKPISNLPEISNIVDSSWFYETHDYDTYEEAYDDFLKDKERINNAIELWLQEFDSKYGTDYAPTGTWRNQRY